MGPPRRRILRVVLCHRAQFAAVRAVKRAVKNGRLPNLKKKCIKCADCDARATAYDHRRYSRPLEVEPVCRLHNRLRGFALDQTFKDAITGEPKTEADYRAERCKQVRMPADRVLYAFTGRPGYLKRQAESAQLSDTRRRGKWRIAMEKRNAYLNAEHEYCLRLGGEDTGERKTMTGLEAVRLNRAAEQDFIRAMQSDKTKRMYRWCLAYPIQRAA